MAKIVCPICRSSNIKINTYASDNIFDLSKSRWFEKTGRWVCENCGQFIKQNKDDKNRREKAN